MAVVIRLRRIGRKNKDIFRVVVADKRAPRDGKFIEVVGQYDPNTEPPHIALKKDRIDYWLSKGAKPSETVASLIRKAVKNEASQGK
jgi:small subunit ribosomal protein S16